MLIVQLIYNLATLISASVISGFIDKRWDRKSNTGKIFHGITFGFIAILAMLNPFILSPGVIFDGRSIVLSLAALFFGPIPGVIAGIMAITARIIIGGGGALMGASVIASSVIIGLLAYLMRERKHVRVTMKNLYLFGIVVHVVMLVLMFFLPTNFVSVTFRTVAISVILFYPFTTVIIGRILIDQENNIRLFNELKESEERWQFALEGPGDGVWDWNIQTNKVYFSHQWKAMLGYENNEISNELDEWDKRVHPEEKLSVYEEINKHFRGEIPVYQSEHRIKCKNGSYKWILDRGKVISWDTDGKPLRVIGSHSDITQRKKAEAELNESHLKFLTLASKIPGHLAYVKADTLEYEFVNEAFEKSFGIPRDKIIGSHIKEIIGQDNYQFALEYINQVRLGRSVSYENSFNLVSGKRWIQVNYSPGFDTSGNVVSIVVLSFDITERKIAEEAKKESEKKFRTLVEKAVDIIFTTDNNGYFTYANPKAIKESGYLLEELTQMKYIDLIEPEYKSRVSRNYFKQYLNKTALSTTEYPFRTKSGDIKWFHQNASLIIDNEEVKGFYIIARDVTERRKVEEALKESEERFRSLYENSTIGLYRTNVDGQIILANNTLVKLLGYSSFEELSIRNLEKDGFHPSYERKQFRDQIELNGEVIGLEAAWIGKDGKVVSIRESAKAIHDSSGKILYYDGTVEDISERKAAEEKIINSLKEKEILLKEVHHRVKNNFQIIISLLNLQAENISDEKILGTLKDSQNRINSMSLIHELMYSTEDLVNINLQNYISKLLEYLKNSYFLNDRRISIKLDIDEVVLQFDNLVPIGLIINELISNSFKHAFPDGRKGEILISIKIVDEERCLLSVKDTGIGLPKEFDLQKGKSLGMFLVNTLSRQINGELNFSGSDSGTETTIIFKRLQKFVAVTGTK